MMSPRLRHVLAFTLAALLFVSTAGVPVHKMICLCQGDQMISWFSAAEMGCCQHSEVQPEQNCCASKGSDKDSKKRNCQDKETTLARIDVQFLADKTIHESVRSLDLFSLPAGVGHNLVPGFDLAEVYYPPVVSIIPSGPPLYRMVCQIRC